MTLAERIYQMLLWLYPAKHRRAYAEPMLQHARDLSRSARQRGSWHILVLCLSLLKDGIVNAGIEHLEASMMVNNRSKPFLIWIFANILGCGALAASLFVSPYLMSLSGIVLTAFIVSFPISLAQWIALRRFFPTTILWIITIPVGLIIILQMYQVFFKDIHLEMGHGTSLGTGEVGGVTQNEDVILHLRLQRMFVGGDEVQFIPES